MDTGARVGRSEGGSWDWTGVHTLPRWGPGHSTLTRHLTRHPSIIRYKGELNMTQAIQYFSIGGNQLTGGWLGG